FAGLGLNVYFVRTNQQGKQEKMSLPRDKAKLVAVHRDLDLALIDVTAAASELAEWGIRPVPLAKADHVTAVGQHIFAIGHQGDAAGGVLTPTLSDGIVSAVNRSDGIVSAVNRSNKFIRGTFLQVTAAINPGNSGGPIFNDEGEVVAIATFVIG